MSRLLLLILFCWSVSSYVSAMPVSEPRFAVCVVKAQGLLLQVQDRLSGRYALPGGYVESGEAGAEAARRELYEETGLQARTLQRLPVASRNGDFYACQLLNPMQWSANSGDINILSAPHLGREIIRARLLTPQNIAATAPQRFADQWSLIEPYWLQIPESPVSIQADFRTQANLLQQHELLGLQYWQHWGRQWPLWWLTNLPGTLAFWLCCLPFWRWRLGDQAVHQSLTGTLLVLSLVELMKVWLAWPRPFHFMPELAWHTASGYGMPSGHTALALFFTLLLGWQAGWGKTVAWCSAAAITVGVALTRTVWGVHFFSDTVVGAVIGLFAFGLIRHHWRPRQLTLFSTGAAGILLFATWHYQSQPLLQLLGAWFGGLLARWRYPVDSQPSRCAQSKPRLIKEWGWIGITLLLQALLPYGTLGSLSLLSLQTLLWCTLSYYLIAPPRNRLRQYTTGST